MIKIYIGNGKTIYTLTSGTEIVLNEEELKELLEENDLVKDLEMKVKKTEEELNESESSKRYYRDLADDKTDEIHDLKKDIEDLRKVAKPFISVEDFKTIKWTGQMEVEYQNRIYPVVTVDLQDIKIGIEVSKNKMKFVDCTSCRLLG